MFFFATHQTCRVSERFIRLSIYRRACRIGPESDMCIARTPSPRGAPVRWGWKRETKRRDFLRVSGAWPPSIIGSDERRLLPQVSRNTHLSERRVCETWMHVRGGFVSYEYIFFFFYPHKWAGFFSPGFTEVITLLIASTSSTWMSRDGSGWIKGDRISGVFHPN